MKEPMKRLHWLLAVAIAIALVKAPAGSIIELFARGLNAVPIWVLVLIALSAATVQEMLMYLYLKKHHR